MTSDALRNLAARSLFTHVQGEVEVEQIAAHSRWQVDLTDATIVFHGQSEQKYPLQLIGSIAHAAGTWLWGWDDTNADHVPSHALDLTRQVRRRGLELGIPELTTPVVALHETPSLLLQLAAESLGLVNHTLSVDAGRGLSLVFAVDLGPLRAPTAEGLIGAAMRGADLGITDDHREAFLVYARRVGLDMVCLSEHTQRYRLAGAAGGLEFETDENGRMVALHEIVYETHRNS